MIDVDLWLWPLDDLREADRVGPWLSSGEAAKAERYVQAHHAIAYRIGRGRMREILATYVGTSPAELPLTTEPGGKPLLASGPVFNLSHAGGWAALAVAPQPTEALSLGLDIERHRKVEPGLAERFFSPAENSVLSKLRGAEWERAFFRCWTRKEAVVKALGEGLAMPLDGFDVTLDAGASPRLTRIDPAHGNPDEWSLHHIALAPDFVGALALRPGPAQIRLCGGAAVPLAPRQE